MEWKKLHLPIMQNIYKKFRIFRMNINVHVDTGSIPKLAKNVSNFSAQVQLHTWDVLAFSEQLSIITRSFFSSVKQRTIISVSPGGNLIMTLLLLSLSRNYVACAITFVYTSFYVLNSGPYVSLDYMLNILHLASLERTT